MSRTIRQKITKAKTSKSIAVPWRTAEDYGAIVIAIDNTYHYTDTNSLSIVVKKPEPLIRRTDMIPYLAKEEILFIETFVIKNKQKVNNICFGVSKYKFRLITIKEIHEFIKRDPNGLREYDMREHLLPYMTDGPYLKKTSKFLKSVGIGRNNV